MQPYKKPGDKTLDIFKKSILDPKTSSDCLALLVKAVRENIFQFETIQRTLADTDSILTHQGIKRMKSKAEQYLRIIAGF